MGDPLAAVFIVIAVAAIAAVVFGAWLLVTVLRLVGRGIAAIFRPFPPAPLPRVESAQCPRSICRAMNPAGARYCRRCGQPLASASHRYAAMW